MLKEIFLRGIVETIDIRHYQILGDCSIIEIYKSLLFL